MKNKFRALQLVLALFLAGCFTLAWADHFKPLSPDHTSYGVAQLNYGNVPGRESFSTFRPIVKLMNPVHVTQVVALIVYEADRGREPGTAETFALCVVRQLTPHASIGIPEIFFDTGDPGRALPKYAEAIWAPVDKVSPGKDNDGDSDSDKKKGKSRRIADGLGGYFETGVGDREGDTQLAHPGLFSLPSDTVVAGQRQAAIDCVLAGLGSLGLSLDIFEDFGIE